MNSLNKKKKSKPIIGKFIAYNSNIPFLWRRKTEVGQNWLEWSWTKEIEDEENEVGTKCKEKKKKEEK